MKKLEIKITKTLSTDTSVIVSIPDDFEEDNLEPLIKQLTEQVKRDGSFHLAEPTIEVAVKPTVSKSKIPGIVYVPELRAFCRYNVIGQSPVYGLGSPKVAITPIDAEMTEEFRERLKRFQDGKSAVLVMADPCDVEFLQNAFETSQDGV